VEWARAWVGDDQRVGADGAGSPRDRTEVPGPLDRHRDGDEWRWGRLERVERGRRAPDHGEKAVGPPLGQAGECIRTQLDDLGATTFGGDNEIAVTAARGRATSTRRGAGYRQPRRGTSPLAC